MIIREACVIEANANHNIFADRRKLTSSGLAVGAGLSARLCGCCRLLFLLLVLITLHESIELLGHLLEERHLEVKLGILLVMVEKLWFF